MKMKLARCDDCHTTRMKVRLLDDGDGGVWVSVECPKCGRLVYYNGA
jgi:RNase P subunit RPR2